MTKPWNDYFMNIAAAVATRSKDLNTKVGAVLVDRDMRIISTGFNGFPPGADESPDNWLKPSAYSRIIHAEVNAIARARCDLRGHFLYVTLQPCRECLKLIAAVGIDRVFFRDEYAKESAESYLLARFFGIDLVQIPG